jgi:hypothetical protein
LANARSGSCGPVAPGTRNGDAALGWEGPIRPPAA